MLNKWNPKTSAYNELQLLSKTKLTNREKNSNIQPCNGKEAMSTRWQNPNSINIKLWNSTMVLVELAWGKIFWNFNTKRSYWIEKLLPLKWTLAGGGTHTFFIIFNQIMYSLKRNRKCYMLTHTYIHTHEYTGGQLDKYRRTFLWL